jgi:hypothetical protein
MSTGTRALWAACAGVILTSQPAQADAVSRFRDAHAPAFPHFVEVRESLLWAGPQSIDTNDAAWATRVRQPTTLFRALVDPQRGVLRSATPVTHLAAPRNPLVGTLVALDGTQYLLNQGTAAAERVPPGEGFWVDEALGSAASVAPSLAPHWLAGRARGRPIEELAVQPGRTVLRAQGAEVEIDEQDGAVLAKRWTGPGGGTIEVRTVAFHELSPFPARFPRVMLTIVRGPDGSTTESAREFSAPVRVEGGLDRYFDPMAFTTSVIDFESRKVIAGPAQEPAPLPPWPPAAVRPATLWPDQIPWPRVPPAATNSGPAPTSSSDQGDPGARRGSSSGPLTPTPTRLGAPHVLAALGVLTILAGIILWVRRRMS